MGYEYEWRPGLLMRQCVFNLNNEQVAMILPFVKKQRDLCKARYDKAQDIVDGGWATPRQLDRSTEAESEFQKWDSLYNELTVGGILDLPK